MFKELIKMLAFLLLSVAVLVVMGGSDNSPMLGITLEAAFYGVELAKDIRMLCSFIARAFSLPIFLAKQSYLYTVTTASNFMCKEEIYPQALSIHKGESFLCSHLVYILFANDHAFLKYLFSI